MNFAAPAWLAVAALASLGVVAIHLIAWRQPESVSLPTARFVPDEPARRATRTVRLSDLALMALRVAIVLLASVGMARPSRDRARSGTARVIVVERRPVRADIPMADTIRALMADRVVSVIAFDTAAQAVDVESALAPANGAAHPSLSGGLVAGIREARKLAGIHERVDIVLASSFPEGAFDAATRAIRATWPDTIRLVRLPPAESPPAGSVDVRSHGDDPVAAGIRLAVSQGLARGTARVLRDPPTPEDSAWIAPGRVLVVWPRKEDAAATVEAVHATRATVVGYFSRGSGGDSGRVVARWTNGDPAAREVSWRGSCLRTIGFDVPDAGDLTLTPSFQRLAAELVGPCGGSWSVATLSDSALHAFADPPSTAVVEVTPGPAVNRLAAVLVALAALLAVAEMFVRDARVAGSRVAGQDA